MSTQGAKAHLPNFILLTALCSRRSNQVAPPGGVRSGNLESVQTGLDTYVCKDDQLVRFAYRCCREANHVTALILRTSQIGQLTTSRPHRKSTCLGTGSCVPVRAVGPSCSDMFHFLWSSAALTTFVFLPVTLRTYRSGIRPSAGTWRAVSLKSLIQISSVSMTIWRESITSTSAARRSF